MRSSLFGLPVSKALAAKACLISIRDKHAANIIDERKRWEFRRQLPCRFPDPRVFVVYASGNVRRIVGAFWCDEYLRDLPLGELWQDTRAGAGISEFEFRRYFEGKSTGSALRISRFEPVDWRSLGDLRIGSPPQSWRYLTIPEWVSLAWVLFGPFPKDAGRLVRPAGGGALGKITSNVSAATPEALRCTKKA